jgi:Ser/Thr protein kinase RdoA (MazF antagonist)
MERVICSTGHAAVVLSEGAVSLFVEEVVDEATRSVRELRGGLEADVFAAETASGRYAVKVSPAWRDEDELDWVRAVARFSHVQVPEAVAPLGQGRVLGRSATVYPLVEGEPLPAGDRESCLDAGRVLGQLHRALMDWEGGPRPPHGPNVPIFMRIDPGADDVLADFDTPELVDPELDDWWATVAAFPWTAGPIQGDYRHANLLCEHNRVIAVIDWDYARIVPYASELAVASQLIPDDPDAFVAAYLDAGGPVTAEETTMLVPLLRLRIRDIARRERAPWGLAPDDPWLEHRYRAFRQLQA